MGIQSLCPKSNPPISVPCHLLPKTRSKPENALGMGIKASQAGMDELGEKMTKEKEN